MAVISKHSQSHSLDAVVAVELSVARPEKLDVGLRYGPPSEALENGDKVVIPLSKHLAEGNEPFGRKQFRPAMRLESKGSGVVLVVIWSRDWRQLKKVSTENDLRG